MVPRPSAEKVAVLAVFRRTKPEVPTGTDVPASGGATAYAGGKGRPTPTRKEAEAAARARAKAALDPKAARSGRTGSTATSRRVDARTVREGIRSGDERYLRPRDKGPVRRFVRDYVDARLCMAELAIPGFFASFLVSTLGFPEIGTALLNALMLVIIIDSVLLRFRLVREVKRRFPEESTKGVTGYGLIRSLQVRFLRIPKPQVRLGQPLPASYR